MDEGKPRLFSASQGSLRWLEILLSPKSCQGGHQEPGVAALCCGKRDSPLARTVIFRMGPSSLRYAVASC